MNCKPSLVSLVETLPTVPKRFILAKALLDAVDEKVRAWFCIIDLNIFVKYGFWPITTYITTGVYFIAMFLFRVNYQRVSFVSRVCSNCKIHLLIKPIKRIIKYIKERSKKSCIQVQPVIIISSHRLLHILVPENM